MVDVFISYSRTNQDVVARLAEAVKAEGYGVWWDAELPPHLSYGDVITEKIGSARAAIVVWSRNAAASEWVRAEADVARNQKKLIQVAVDDTMPPLPFNQIQFASLVDWRGEPDHQGWRKVKASLVALCGERDGSVTPQAAAAPSPPPRPDPPPPVPARPAPRTLLLVALVAGLFAAAAAAAFWMTRDRPRQTVSVQPVVPPAPSADPAAPPASAPDPASSGGGRFIQPAVIDDPDGYTNLRSAASAGAAILARVEEGEVFTTFPQRGAWWQVRTADGTIGYMAGSRVRLLEAGRPAARPTAADPPQILPHSSSRLLGEADLEGLAPLQLRIARNEIYARNGRDFRDPGLRRHFERYGWYAPRAAEVRLSAVEQANVRLLQEAEEAKR